MLIVLFVIVFVFVGTISYLLQQHYYNQKCDLLQCKLDQVFETLQS